MMVRGVLPLPLLTLRHEAWCESGMNNVTEDFGEEINKELFPRYALISSR